MASYRGHLSFAAPLAAAYGALGVWQWDFDWGDVGLAAGLVTAGGLAPDLDSDSGVPVRELFNLAAVVGALLVYARLRHGLNHEQAIVVAGLIFLFIRYPLSQLFKWATVHRGMFHSLPAMCIAGLGLYLLLPGRDLPQRYYLAGAIMLGYLSHLVLDELYAVDLSGLIIKTNQFAGSALKFFSKSAMANCICYGILTGLVWVSYQEEALLPMEAPAAVKKPRMRFQRGNRPNREPMVPTEQNRQQTPSWDRPHSPILDPREIPMRLPSPVLPPSGPSPYPGKQ
jgi:membrane-bound metal-dependent hydrolase YbcI (DUF457 family)